MTLDLLNLKAGPSEQDPKTYTIYNVERAPLSVFITPIAQVFGLEEHQAHNLAVLFTMAPLLYDQMELLINHLLKVPNCPFCDAVRGTAHKNACVVENIIKILDTLEHNLQGE